MDDGSVRDDLCAGRVDVSVKSVHGVRAVSKYGLLGNVVEHY